MAKKWICKTCGGTEFIVNILTCGTMGFTSSDPETEAVEMLNRERTSLYRCWDCGAGGAIERIAEYKEA